MNALLIAHNTFREAVRDRVLTGIVVGGLLLIAMTRIASPLAMGEDLLTEKGIVIPSDDRTGDPDEAHLFGTEYSRLEEAIVAIMLGEP